MLWAVQHLAVLLLLASTVLPASARPAVRGLLQDQTVTTPTASSKGAKIIVNTLRMITREESDKAAAAAAVEATVAAAAAAAAADSDSGVSIARAAMSPQQNKIVLDTHNKYRSWHQVGALAWSDTVAAAAMDYASKCTWNHDPNNNAYGENLYATSETSGDLSTYLQDAVDGWYSEVTNCNFAQPESCFDSGAGHLTQLIWKSSRDLGCAAVKCSSLQGLPDWTEGGTIVVCRYNPPGNYWGAFSANIFPRTNGNTGINPPSPPPQNPPPETPSPSPELPQNPNPNPSNPPPAGTPRNFQLGATLQAGWFISAESGCISSTNKQYKMCITAAGNVTVLQLRPRKVVWASNTRTRKAAEMPALLWLGDDNVLSVVGKTFSNIGFSTPACSWCSRSKSVLVMQDDGNLVLYGGSTFLLRQFVVRVDGRILWQTGVPGKKRN